MRYNLLRNRFIVDLSLAIKEQAQRLGFSLVGITTSDRLPHEEVFKAWLDLGRQGEMAYMDTPRSRQCRAQPKQLLPECLSALVLGASYPAPIQNEPEGKAARGLRGKVAAYAWGLDYHEFLAEWLKTLVQFIETEVGHPIPNRWYTDTGPILERELAQRAGLGWIGKNTCLINPRQGSYFFLAEILLGIELKPDQPFSHDRCGSCTRCIHACPTGCILPDRTLDARRCLSYLTIELKGLIPLELRPLIGDWVFGCDICQQVCPWNRFAAARADSVPEPQLAQRKPALLEELTQSVEEFNHKYRHSPLRRARRGGYLRNIAVALGNLHSLESVKPLALVLVSDPDPMVRVHVAWALGQIGTITATHALQQAAILENDPLVKLEIEDAIVNHS